MQATAHSLFARFSSRKVGQVLKLIRGKSVSNAGDVLTVVPRSCRVLVEKTLKSAFSNAGKGADPRVYKVSEAWVNYGPPLKRVRPRAMGGRAMYKRKTCHLTITVTDEKS